MTVPSSLCVAAAHVTSHGVAVVGWGSLRYGRYGLTDGRTHGRRLRRSGPAAGPLLAPRGAAFAQFRAYLAPRGATFSANFAHRCRQLAARLFGKLEEKKKER